MNINLSAGYIDQGCIKQRLSLLYSDLKSANNKEKFLEIVSGAYQHNVIRKVEVSNLPRKLFQEFLDGERKLPLKNIRLIIYSKKCKYFPQYKKSSEYSDVS